MIFGFQIAINDYKKKKDLFEVNGFLIVIIGDYVKSDHINHKQLIKLCNNNVTFT